MSAKKAIIFENDGGELANQLWNYISVYAYAKEKGFDCENYSFFEYSHIFKNLKPSSLVVRSLFFNKIKKTKKRRYAFLSRFWRNFYKLTVVKPLRLFLKNNVVYSSEGKDYLYYLPPTQESSEKLKNLENSQSDIYFASVSGGVFRNPVGINVFRQNIQQHFEPVADIKKSVENFMSPLRANYKYIIGVHVRQSDFKDFKSGKYWIPQQRAREIMSEYLGYTNKKHEETCFVICSDQAIDESLFQGLNNIVTKKSMGEDLFILSSCDAIIGSDSTFGHFAAYYGNIPHIVMKNEAMDWGYYKDKKSYTQNKYLTVMVY
jgi:ADP-heptose:LPS heptosyltransferase